MKPSFSHQPFVTVHLWGNSMVSPVWLMPLQPRYPVFVRASVLNGATGNPRQISEFLLRFEIFGAWQTAVSEFTDSCVTEFVIYAVAAVWEMLFLNMVEFVLRMCMVMCLHGVNCISLAVYILLYLHAYAYAHINSHESVAVCAYSTYV